MLQLVPMVYCIITNDFEKSPKEAMDFYESRGNSENFTKELKDDFNGGILSHKEFVKNGFSDFKPSLQSLPCIPTNDIRRKRSDNTNEHISIEISENSSQSDTTRKTGNA